MVSKENPTSEEVGVYRKELEQIIHEIATEFYYLGKEDMPVEVMEDELSNAKPVFMDAVLDLISKGVTNA